jgi:hypothetical protein
MPRLHKYRNRDACYVLTAIRGAVVTYQLTPEGDRKLAAAGIAPGQQFNRALLLDLYRSGDAFTGGSGVDDPSVLAAGQMEMDFANDPDPETAFPACDVCRSVNDLHLTITGRPEDLIAQLQCAVCRTLPAARPDTSIPVALITRPMLARLFQMKSVAGKSPSVKQFEHLLAAEFESKWASVRQQRGAAQPSLFGSSVTGGLNLH